MINERKVFDYYILNSLYNDGEKKLKCGCTPENDKHKLSGFLKNCICIPNILCKKVNTIFSSTEKCIISRCSDYGTIELADGRYKQVCGYSLREFSNKKYLNAKIYDKSALDMYKTIFQDLDFSFYIHCPNDLVILLCMLMGLFCEKYSSESENIYIRQLCQEISNAYKEEDSNCEIVEQVFYCVCLLLNYDNNDSFEWKNFLIKWYENHSNICDNVCNDLEGIFKVKRNINTLFELCNIYKEKNLVITVLFILKTVCEKNTAFVGINGLISMLNGVIPKITSELLSNNKQKDVSKPLHNFYNELKKLQ